MEDFLMTLAAAAFGFGASTLKEWLADKEAREDRRVEALRGVRADLYRDAIGESAKAVTLAVDAVHHVKTDERMEEALEQAHRAANACLIASFFATHQAQLGFNEFNELFRDGFLERMHRDKEGTVAEYLRVRDDLATALRADLGIPEE